MQVQEFIDRVNEAKELSIEEHAEEQKAMLVRNDRTGIGYTVLYEAVEKHDWETLAAVLFDKREPLVLTHMTRIVGYFAQVENFNRSKIGELRARRKGNYTFEGHNDNAGQPFPVSKTVRPTTVVDTSARSAQAIEQGAE